MRKFLMLLALACAPALEAAAQKTMYVPREWRDRTDTLIYKESDPECRYTWSKSRSKETANAIILWDKGYGKVSPSNAEPAYRVDIDDLAAKVEEFYALEISRLGFVDEASSNLSKYKVMVLLNHSSEWVCFGSGYDFEVPALWLSPMTCKPVGQSVAHEVGHSFHYMCYSEASDHGRLPAVQTGFHSPVGRGSVTWEQTAQWQSLQSYPELMFDQSIGVFRNSHNYAMTHEWHRYQSYWFLYYLCQRYGDITTVAQVWNRPETRVADFNQALMDLKGLSVAELYEMYYDYAKRLVTWDLDVCAPYRARYVGDLAYRCAAVGEREYQVALSSCPQSTGFNAVPLAVPQAGTEVSVDFTAISPTSKLADDDPGQYLDGDARLVASSKRRYNSVSSSLRGFRLGFVALMANGERRYYDENRVCCTGIGERTERLSLTVPEGAERLWLVVSPALSAYIQHKWDESIEGDDMWPYRIKIEGTDLASSATVHVSPTLDQRAPGDITLTYDVRFPTSATDYVSAQLTLSPREQAAVATALQLTPADMAARMQAYSASGPSAGKLMFCAAKADGTLARSGSTANGYGHWFGADGNVSPYASGRVFSEYEPSTMTFTLGQYPGRLREGQEFTIRQALQYRTAGGEKAVAMFVFHIRLDASRTSVELAGVEYDEERAVGIDAPRDCLSPTLPGDASAALSGPVDIYDLSGRRVRTATPISLAALSPGVYIANGRKFVVGNR